MLEEAWTAISEAFDRCFFFDTGANHFGSFAHSHFEHYEILFNWLVICTCNSLIWSPFELYCFLVQARKTSLQPNFRKSIQWEAEVQHHKVCLVVAKKLAMYPLFDVLTAYLGGRRYQNINTHCLPGPREIFLGTLSPRLSLVWVPFPSWYWIWWAFEGLAGHYFFLANAAIVVENQYSGPKHQSE